MLKTHILNIQFTKVGTPELLFFCYQFQFQFQDVLYSYSRKEFHSYKLFIYKIWMGTVFSIKFWRLDTFDTIFAVVNFTKVMHYTDIFIMNGYQREVINRV